MRAVALLCFVATTLATGACRTSPDATQAPPTREVTAAPLVDASAPAASDDASGVLDASIPDAAASAFLAPRPEDGPLQDLAIGAALPEYWRHLHGDHPPSPPPSTFVVGSRSLIPLHAQVNCSPPKGRLIPAETAAFCNAVVGSRPIVNLRRRGAKIRDVDAYMFGSIVQTQYGDQFVRATAPADAWPTLVVSEVIRDATNVDSGVFVVVGDRGFFVGFWVALHRVGPIWKVTKVEMTFIT